MEIIVERETTEFVKFGLSYERMAPGVGGFIFDSDKDGNIAELNPVARQSLRAILTGKIQVRHPEIVEFRHSYTSPAAGRCVCGEEVILEGFTNTCECGRDYNMSGQLLSSREFWGEETGESLYEILAIT